MVNEVWIEVTPDLPWWVDGCLYTFIVRMFIVLIPHTHSVLKSYLPVYNMENGSALTYILMSAPTTAYKEKRCICIPASPPKPTRLCINTSPRNVLSGGPLLFPRQPAEWGKEDWLREWQSKTKCMKTTGAENSSLCPTCRTSEGPPVC